MEKRGVGCRGTIDMDSRQREAYQRIVAICGERRRRPTLIRRFGFNFLVAIEGIAEGGRLDGVYKLLAERGFGLRSDRRKD